MRNGCNISYFRVILALWALGLVLIGFTLLGMWVGVPWVHSVDALAAALVVPVLKRGCWLLSLGADDDHTTHGAGNSHVPHSRDKSK